MSRESPSTPAASTENSTPLTQTALEEKLKDIFYGNIGYGAVSWDEAKDGIYEIYNLGFAAGAKQ